jgi:hypothetical protein
MATTDLATTSRQFSQVTNQLQVVTEKASRLRDSNAKLSHDLEGKSNDPPVLVWFSVCSLSGLDFDDLGCRVAHDPREDGGAAGDGQARVKRRNPQSHREERCPQALVREALECVLNFGVEFLFFFFFSSPP